ncbi:MAG: hypothetical protein R2705_23645 [Ilumatobacteraceae bacterium]
MKRTHTALAGLTALMLVASACGDDRTIAGGDSPDSTPAVADGRIAPRPVRIGPGSSPTGSRLAAESASAGDLAGDVAVDSMMIAPWGSLSFQLGADLALPTADTGWVYAGIVTPDLDRIASLAAALGIAGPVETVPADQGGGWRVGPGDGSAPSLWVSATGQLDWWYSPAWATIDRGVVDTAVGEPAVDPALGPDEAPPVDPADAGVAADDPVTVDDDMLDEDMVVVGEDAIAPDETIPPPVNVPDEATARQLAADLFQAAGVDVSGMQVDVYADEWQASVSYSSTDTSRPPVYLSAGFGENGTLVWASGMLGEPQAAGPFPLVGLDDAMNRLNEYYGFEMTDDAPMLRSDTVAVAEDTAPAAVAEDTASVASDEAMPVPDDVEFVDKVANLVSVESSLWVAWDSDGSVWYVPAYEFADDEGGLWIVPAVTDEYLIVDPAMDAPAIEEPAMVEPGVEDVAPAPAPETPASPGAEITDDQASALVGLSEDEARKVAEGNGWDVRVVARDGEQFAVTADYSTSRVNLTVDAGTVTSVSIG